MSQAELWKYFCTKGLQYFPGFPPYYTSDKGPPACIAMAKLIVYDLGGPGEARIWYKYFGWQKQFGHAFVVARSQEATDYAYNNYLPNTKPYTVEWVMNGGKDKTDIYIREDWSRQL